MWRHCQTGSVEKVNPDVFETVAELESSTKAWEAFVGFDLPQIAVPGMH
jgi:hypothetical protein